MRNVFLEETDKKTKLNFELRILRLFYHFFFFFEASDLRGKVGQNSIIYSIWYLTGSITSQIVRGQPRGRVGVARTSHIDERYKRLAELALCIIVG